VHKGVESWDPQDSKWLEVFLADFHSELSFCGRCLSVFVTSQRGEDGNEDW